MFKEVLNLGKIYLRKDKARNSFQKINELDRTKYSLAKGSNCGLRFAKSYMILYAHRKSAIFNAISNLSTERC